MPEEGLWMQGIVRSRMALNLLFREVTVKDDKARRELGYAPGIRIEEGLQELKDER